MRTLPILMVIPGALLLTGCDVELGGFNERAQQDFRYSYALKPGATFNLETMNGSVDIAGWDREEIEITGVKYARTEELRDAVRIDVTHSDRDASVRTVAPSGMNTGAGARYVIRLPRKVELQRIATSNANVRINDIDGPARVKTSNAAIAIEKVTGNVDAQSSNGTVEANRVDGAARLHTSNGHVGAAGVKGEVDASSSNGSISLTMSEGLGGRVRASTSNSSIQVAIPAVPAQVRAQTSNSSITSEFEVGGTREEKHHLEGAINGGSGSSPLLDLSTSNGSIRITKF